MLLAEIGHPIYYMVRYRRKRSSWNPLFCQTIGCYEDVRDAVQAIVTAYQKNPCCSGEFGIVRTTIEPSYKFHRSSYRVIDDG